MSPLLLVVALALQEKRDAEPSCRRSAPDTKEMIGEAASWILHIGSPPLALSPCDCPGTANKTQMNAVQALWRIL